MEILKQYRKHALLIVSHLLLAFLSTTVALAEPPIDRRGGWKLQKGVERPSYAVTEPVRSNLNIGSVVLACEDTEDRNVLQLQIYLSTEGPLLPNGAPPRRLKAAPRAEIVIDNLLFRVGLFFADDYAVLADEGERYPLLSERLLDAMEKGKTMVLRFDLVAELTGQSAGFDGEAVIDLQAGAGGTAIAAIRRCAGTTTDRLIGVANARYSSEPKVAGF